MVTLMEARPEVRAQEVRCEGTRKDGRRCNYLLAVVVLHFTGKLLLKCPKCHEDRTVETHTR
jgi:phage FluMu protein Com